MFCKKCGHEIDSDSLFCQKCGAKQHTQQETIPQPNSIPPISPMPPQTEKVEEKISKNEEGNVNFTFIKDLFVPNGRRNRFTFLASASFFILLMLPSWWMIFRLGIYPERKMDFPFLAFISFLLCVYINAVNMSKRMMDCGYNKFTSFVLAAFFLFGCLFIPYSMRFGPFMDARGDIDFYVFMFIVGIYLIANLFLVFKGGTPGPNEYGEEPITKNVYS